MNISEIKIHSSASASQMPDSIRVVLRFSSKALTYKESVGILNNAIENSLAVINECNPLNIPSTSSFGIDERWSNRYQEEESKFLGYEAQQNMDTVLDLDMANLQKLLEGLSSMRTKVKPQIRFVFEVRDTERLLKKARQLAIQSAKVAAEDMAHQLGLRISGIRYIEYNQPESSYGRSIDVELGEELMCMSSQTSLTMPSINPREVVRLDGVTITWRCTS